MKWEWEEIACSILQEFTGIFESFLFWIATENQNLRSQDLSKYQAGPGRLLLTSEVFIVGIRNKS